MHVIEARLRFVQPHKICICVAIQASSHSHCSYRILHQSVRSVADTIYMNIEWRLGREIIEQPHVRYNTLWKWEICMCRSKNDYSLVTTPAPAPNNNNTHKYTIQALLCRSSVGVQWKMVQQTFNCCTLVATMHFACATRSWKWMHTAKLSVYSFFTFVCGNFCIFYYCSTCICWPF